MDGPVAGSTATGWWSPGERGVGRTGHGWTGQGETCIILAAWRGLLFARSSERGRDGVLCHERPMYEASRRLERRMDGLHLDLIE